MWNTEIKKREKRGNLQFEQGFYSSHDYLRVSTISYEKQMTLYTSPLQTQLKISDHLLFGKSSRIIQCGLFLFQINFWCFYKLNIKFENKNIVFEILNFFIIRDDITQQFLSVLRALFLHSRYSSLPTLFFLIESTLRFLKNYILFMLLHLSQIFPLYLLHLAFPSLRQCQHHCPYPWVLHICSPATLFLMLYFTSSTTPQTPSHLKTIKTFYVSIILFVYGFSIFYFRLNC